MHDCLKVLTQPFLKFFHHSTIFFIKTLILDFLGKQWDFSPLYFLRTFQVLTTWTTTSCHALLKRSSNLDIGTPKWPTFHLKTLTTTAAAAFLKSDSNKCITYLHTLCSKENYLWTLTLLKNGRMFWNFFDNKLLAKV